MCYIYHAYMLSEYKYLQVWIGWETLWEYVKMFWLWFCCFMDFTERSELEVTHMDQVQLLSEWPAEG